MEPSPPVPGPGPRVIGLLGGIAAGKSTVASLLAEEGMEVVDADRIAQEVAGRPQILEALVERFGAGILDARGALDRAALAERAFADPGLRRALEAILHPPVRAHIQERLARAPRDRPLVLDVPLLLEGGLDGLCDVLLFVEASPEARAERAAERGWSREELERRQALQAPLDVKRARAHHIIANSSSLAQARRQIHQLLPHLVS